MTASRFLADETDVWTLAAVIVPLAFVAVLWCFHRWWQDTYGRGLVFLALALAGARLSPALALWHVHWAWTRWVSAQALATGPVVFGTLAWKVVQPRLPWARGRRNALEDILRGAKQR